MKMIKKVTLFLTGLALVGVCGGEAFAGQSPRDSYISQRRQGYTQPAWMGQWMKDEYLANTFLKSCRFNGWGFAGQCDQIRWEMQFRGYKVKY